MAKLREWKESKNRKPLILRGARQVGKTSVVQLFSKEYDQFLSLNLERPSEKILFENELSVKELFQAICLHFNIEPVQNGKILLFIDEIQNSGKAIAILRYFYEELPKLHVIAAGSLLEVSLSEKKVSFPVGRVEFLYLYPLTFHEYLIATDQKPLYETLKIFPFPDYALQPTMTAFHRYALIGGMPEVIAQYRENPDIQSLKKIYHSLLTTYIDDVEKYAPGYFKIMQHCILNAPLEAGKRIKFACFGQSNYKSREIGECLRLLEKAMLIYLLHPTTHEILPATSDMKKSPKLQFIDTGLINFQARLMDYFFPQASLHDFYRGLIAEHIVGQELLAISDYHEKPCFWVREKKQSTAEVDYVIQCSQYLIPVEVKSGKTGSLRSLHQFIECAPHPYAIRLYAGKLSTGEEKTPSGKKYILLNLPYFLTTQIYRYAENLIKEYPTARTFP